MNMTNSKQKLINPGKKEATGLGFVGDQDTGIFQDEKGEVAVAVNGTKIASFSTHGITFAANVTNSVSGTTDAAIEDGFIQLKNTFNAGAAAVNAIA